MDWIKCLVKRVVVIFRDKNKYCTKLATSLGVGIAQVTLHAQPARVQISALEIFSGVAELIDSEHCLELVDSAKMLNIVVDRTHPVLVRAVLQKKQKDEKDLLVRIGNNTIIIVYYSRQKSI